MMICATCGKQEGIIAELRQRLKAAENVYIHTPVGHIIEELQANNKRYREAIEEIADGKILHEWHVSAAGKSGIDKCEAIEIARAAISRKGKK